MKIYLFNTREHIYKSFEWLLEKCGHNWKTLDIDQDNDDDYFMITTTDTWIEINRHDAKTWEEIIKNKSFSSTKPCLVHIWVPDDKALLFKLRWC